MRNKILITMFSVCSLMYAAQSIAQVTPVTGDFVRYDGSSDLYIAPEFTIANTTADTVDIKVPNDATGITFFTTYTKASGDDSATIKLYAVVNESESPTGYKLLQTDYMADVSTAQIASTIFVGNPYTNYRIISTGVGTQSATVRSRALIRGRKK